MQEHQAQTDQTTKIEFPSTIQQVFWSKRMAAPGGVVGLEILTHYVGNNSEVKIEVSNHSGKTLGKKSLNHQPRGYKRCNRN